MATEILVNNGSDNGLLPDGTKQLSKPILTSEYWFLAQCNSPENVEDMLENSSLEIHFLKISKHLSRDNELITHFISANTAMWNVFYM